MELVLPVIISSIKVFSALIIVLICFGEFRSDAQVLPDDEVRALQQISTKLRIPYWKNVNQTSCTRGEGLNATLPMNGLSNVTCNCSYNSSTICHIKTIQLKGLNLSGTLPDEFSNLTHLQEIDVSRNYLSGTIPKSWATLPLVILSLVGNKIEGPIPREIFNIATLENLMLQDNQFGGPLPPELGTLRRLLRLILSGNNFTGSLPKTFGDLKDMIDFKIDGTSISGRIPDFIGNWPNLIRLDMQGTSMEGPIPSAIFHLKNLIQLSVSDLKGPDMPFPNLQDMKNMERLILRRCSVSGSIPPNVGEMMPKLKYLDLSFNKLTGNIESLQEISSLRFLYLSNNSLTGQIPQWIERTNWNFDLSYNNFTGSSESSCQETYLNKIASFSSSEDKINDWCLKKNLPCPTEPGQYSLFINCGGPELNINGDIYEQDVSPMGPSSFFSSIGKWACSCMGDFVGNTGATYVAQANPNMTDFYSTARLAPLSLKYYGLCLRKGNYKVKLHFAEIMFRNNQTSSSPAGRRIFDVSIQGERVLKDFNIAEEAGGIRKSIIKEFNVDVTSSTLEIHLYWTGKGTTSIPFRTVYGPLISAITVTPNFDPNPGRRLSVRAIIGIVVASCVFILLIFAFLWKKGYLGGKNLEVKGLRTTRAGKSPGSFMEVS